MRNFESWSKEVDRWLENSPEVPTQDSFGAILEDLPLLFQAVEERLLNCPRDARLRILRRGIRALFRGQYWNYSNEILDAFELKDYHPGWIDQRQEELDDEDLDQILVDMPNCESARIHRARNRFERGNWIGCIADAEAALAGDPMDWQCLELLMSSSLRVLDGKLLLELAEKLATLREDDIGKVLVVHAMAALQEWPMALERIAELLSKGVSLNTGGLGAVRYQALVITGSYTEAAKAMQEYLDATNDEGDGIDSYAGVALYAAIDGEHLVKKVMYCAYAEDDCFNIHVAYAEAYRLQGRQEEAREEIRKCLEYNPSHADAHIILVALLAQDGLIGDAKDIFNKIDPARVRPVIHKYMGNVLGIFESGIDADLQDCPMRWKPGVLQETLVYWPNLYGSPYGLR